MADFLLEALPWVVMGIAAAVALSNLNKKGELSIKKQKGMNGEKSINKEDGNNYMSAGTCLGICFGSVLSLLGIVTLSYGISFGILLGMIVGMCIKKR
ncbi:hypothetical protein [Clostridium sp. BJN0001]|uniref:hypothetical protein n=1 Tax=Clostridium sp. BJN0001 TaxID=2930219 RepID=UPI001FD4FBA1|nr:hypothetical protein [Clostridium sp. BJN0001]